jgi:hypothetical protein
VSAIEAYVGLSKYHAEKAEWLDDLFEHGLPKCMAYDACLTTGGDYRDVWEDELHPTGLGFARCAAKMLDCIGAGH